MILSSPSRILIRKPRPMCLVIPKKHFAGLKEAQAEDAESIRPLPPGGRGDCPATKYRARVPDSAQCRSRRRPVSISSARALVGRTFTKLAAGIGKQSERRSETRRLTVRPDSPLQALRGGAATAAGFARTPTAATPYHIPLHAPSASDHPARGREIR